MRLFFLCTICLHYWSVSKTKCVSYPDSCFCLNTNKRHSFVLYSNFRIIESMSRTCEVFLSHSCEFPQNTHGKQPDWLLCLSFSALCLAVCFDLTSKLSSSSILILKVAPTKMFLFPQLREKPADKNSRGWPLGGCCLYYTTIFISSKDVTLLLRKLDVFSGQTVSPRRPTGQGFSS